MARTGAEALRHLGVKQTIGGVHFCDAPKTRRLKIAENRDYLLLPMEGLQNRQYIYPTNRIATLMASFFMDEMVATRLKPETPNAPTGEALGMTDYSKFRTRIAKQTA